MWNYSLIQFIFIFGICSTQDFSYNINVNGKVGQQQTLDLPNNYVDDYTNLQHQLQPLQLANLLKDTSLVVGSSDCQSALLKLFAPVLNITKWTPAAALSLLRKPVGRGLFVVCLFKCLINFPFFLFFFF